MGYARQFGKPARRAVLCFWVCRYVRLICMYPNGLAERSKASKVCSINKDCWCGAWRLWLRVHFVPRQKFWRLWYWQILAIELYSSTPSGSGWTAGPDLGFQNIVGAQSWHCILGRPKCSVFLAAGTHCKGAILVYRVTFFPDNGAIVLARLSCRLFIGKTKCYVFVFLCTCVGGGGDNRFFMWR